MSKLCPLCGSVVDHPTLEIDHATAVIRIAGDKIDCRKGLFTKFLQKLLDAYPAPVKDKEMIDHLWGGRTPAQPIVNIAQYAMLGRRLLSEFDITVDKWTFPRNGSGYVLVMPKKTNKDKNRKFG